MKNKLTKMFALALSTLVISLSPVSFAIKNSENNITHNRKNAVTTDFVSMSDMSNYLSTKNTNYPISDAFIELYQQKSGGYIDYAKQTGHLIDKNSHEPNQKWHFYSSWLYRSIDEGSLTWDEDAKSRVYTKLLCPELLLWIYEACGVDSDLVTQAYNAAVQGKIDGLATTTIAKNMRSIVSWDNVKADVLANISPNDPHHVTPAVSTEYIVSNLSYEGYLEGDVVTFNIAIKDTTKEIDVVSANNVTITEVGDGQYQFIMPNENVTLSVTTKDAGEVTPVDPDVEPGENPGEETEDLVKTLNWTTRGTINTLRDTRLEDAVSIKDWNFSVTRESGATEKPTFGTGKNNVHIALYDVSKPTVENTPLTNSYEFKLEDNGKYIIACFEGKFSSSNKAITVNDWIDVYQTINDEATYDFTSCVKTSTSELKSTDAYYSSDTVLNGANSIYKMYPDASNSVKLGTGTYSGYFNVSFAEELEITSVTVRAKQYNATEKSVVVMGNTLTLSDTFADYTLTLSNEDFDETNILSINTTDTSKRAYIQSIIISINGTQNIGKTDDCVGLYSFIKTYMHMDDYNENLGYCADSTHHYYISAKEAFNALNTNQRKLFVSYEEYQDAYARLVEWALANGETFSDTNLLTQRVNKSLISNIANENGVAIALAITGVTNAIILVLRKRKEA